MKAKVTIQKIEAEGNCFECGKYSALKFLRTTWVCPACHERITAEQLK